MHAPYHGCGDRGDIWDQYDVYEDKSGDSCQYGSEGIIHQSEPHHLASPIQLLDIEHRGDHVTQDHRQHHL